MIFNSVVFDDLGTEFFLATKNDHELPVSFRDFVQDGHEDVV